MTKLKTHENSPDSLEASKPALIAKALGVAAVGAAVVYGFSQSHNQYGYDPAKNPPPLSFMERNAGINPANIVHDTQDK